MNLEISTVAGITRRPLWKEAAESIGYSLFVWFSMFSDFVEPVQCQHEWHLICFYGFLFTKYNLKSLKRRIKWNSIFWNHRPTTYFFAESYWIFVAFMQNDRLKVSHIPSITGYWHKDMISQKPMELYKCCLLSDYDIANIRTFSSFLKWKNGSFVNDSY